MRPEPPPVAAPLARSVGRVLVLLAFLALPLRADVPIPARVLHPKTPAEAWNVVTLVSANLDRLLSENRLAEVSVQASLASPALRLLAKGPGNSGALGVKGLNAITSLAQAATAGDATATKDGLQSLQAVLRELAQAYPPKEVAAEIFHCPMHPEFASADATTPCDQCGMDLVPRRIPHSFLFVSPGQSVVKLSAVGAAPLRAGQPADLRIRLQQRDGRPVEPKDLLVTHTQPIHLLIVDPTLTDYHHEHPLPAKETGEYTFRFIPRKPGPYRIFADLLPAATSVQEYAVTDLPGEGSSEKAVASRPSTFRTALDGLRFDLELDGGNGAPIVAGRVLGLRVTVTDAAGKPMRGLEPVMNAFAHMVGFHADYQTVVHLHPLGGEVFDQAARGGPTMSFRFLAPKPGYLRLYCQVQVGGKQIFAPFDVNIVAP